MKRETMKKSNDRPPKSKRRKDGATASASSCDQGDGTTTKSNTPANFDESESRATASEVVDLRSESGDKSVAGNDSDSLALPLSLIKGLRRKSSSIGIGSSSSNGGGSGNNSDNSALVSIGNNSFGFNFDSEEMLNSSPQNSEPDGKNGESEDSDGNPVEVTVTSGSCRSSGGSSTARANSGVEGMELDAASPADRGGSSSSQQQCKQSQQHVPPISKPSSSSLNSQQSSSATSDSGSGLSGQSSNGNGSSRSSGKSTVSSLTSATMSSSSKNGTSTTTSSHDAAAAAAVANLQSIVSAYSSQNKSDADANAQGRGSGRGNSRANKSSTSGNKRKSEDDDDNDDNDGNDSGGYNSDDEGGCAASKRSAPHGEAAHKPDAPTSSSSVAVSGVSTTGSAPEAMPSPTQSAAVAQPARSPAPSAIPQAPADVSSPTDAQHESEAHPKKRKKIDDSKREERNAREKERSFRISKQIGELRSLLSSGGVIVPKGTKSSVLTEAANYIRMLQQHQYRSEIDRHQLVQQIQQIGSGAIGPQAAGAIRHVAAQNGVWQLGNFGGVPPRSAMTYYQQGQFGVPGSNGADPNQQMTPEPPLVTRIDELEYRFVFNSCAVGMAIASMGGAFIDCNNMFCQLSQYTKQEVCSMTIFNLTSRVDLQHAFDRISQMISPPADSMDQGGPPSCVLRGAMKHRNDLGLSVTLIKGDDGIAKCFCVTLIKNPISPFDPSRPLPATPDMVLVGGQQMPAPITEDLQKSQSGSSMSSPAYTTG